MNLTGKVSWFGGPGDPTDSGHTANGETTKTPGIAVYNHSTLNGYWRVRAPNGKTVVLKQTDIGPAPWTGRKIDVTYSALGKFGFGEHNFPTDSQFSAEYLGKNPGRQAPESAPAATKLPGAPEAAGFDQAGFQKAQKAAILGKLIASEGSTKGNPLFASGLVSTKAPERSEYSQESKLPGLPTAEPNLPPGKTVAYVNPISGGFTKGRTDMGIDASATPGSPIRAMGNAKILSISPNWYKGQPYLSYELLDGPQRGKVIYVAEQISPTVHAGQTVRAGETIARYAPSGTGIEMGFGTRTPGRTLAQATSGYSEGQETSAGKQFRRLLEHTR